MFEIFKKKELPPKNIKEVLSHLKVLKKELKSISGELEALKKERRFSIQKVGMIRFNPFKEIGSDQSFSIALLDDNNDGVVITSFYSQEGNRVFGKPIKNSGSKYLLSKEEKQAIEKAKINKTLKLEENGK